jgi:pimeloyl-ACP methyl ester carboxylesterase
MVDIGGPVHVADFGGEGQPVVLVHGLGASHTSWMAVGPALAQRRRVLAIDLLGFGRTPPAGRGATMDAQAALLARFLEKEIGEPAVLVGNSMGGLVSVLTAAARPDAVSGLVLVGAALPRPVLARFDARVAAMFLTYMLPGVAELSMWARSRLVPPEQVLRDVLHLCGADPERMLPEAWEASVALARERRTYPWANAAYLGAARSVVRTLVRREHVHDLIRRIPARGLLIQGTEDRLVPAEVSAEVARLRPDWQHEVLQGIGHVPQLQVPERWVEIVNRWLDG